MVKESNSNGAWKSRIKQYIELPAHQIVAHYANARIHPPRQREALRGSLDTLGWVAPVIVNAATGYLLDGHARIEEALTKDENALIPVVEVELSEDEERLFLASYDWITGLAEYDRDALDSLLQEVQTDSEALQSMLSEQANSFGLYFGEPPVIPEDAGAQIDRAAELQQQWQVQRGDLWRIPSITGRGEHRLLCGDSTLVEDVAELLQGEKVDLVFADPPYGVSIGTKNQTLNSVQKAGRNLANIEGDTLSVDDLRIMLTASFKITRAVMKDCSAIYVTAPQGGELGMMMMMMIDAGLPVRHVLIWVKNRATFSIGRLDYDYQHEPILYTWKKAHEHYGNGEHRTSTWFIDNPMAAKEHPTMKPVAVPANAIANSSLPGMVAYDPFGGSGTTMVACEQLSRQCRMIEIEPKYCAVILQRMTDIGCTPEKLS